MVTESPILLWHPRVHEFYNEELRIFLLRYRSYKRKRLKELKKRFMREKTRIRSFTIDEIFGAYDLLLTVWLHRENLSRLTDIIDDLDGLIAYSKFQAEEINEWMFPEDPDASVLTTLFEDVDHIGQIQREISEETTPERDKEKILSEYLEKRVAFYEPVLNENKESFITALAFKGLGPETTETQQEIRNTILDIQKKFKSSNEQIDNLSVFFGEGFARIILKGKAKNLQAISNFLIQQVTRELKGYYPEPTTFLISDESYSHVNGDISDDTFEKFDIGTPPKWFRDMFPKFHAPARDTGTMVEILTFVMDYRSDIRNCPVEIRNKLIRPLLEAVMQGDPEMGISHVLLWFARIESFLRETWMDFLRNVSSLEGKKLAEIDSEIKEEIGVESKLTKHIPFGHLVEMRFKALEKFQRESSVLLKDRRTQELSEIRNEFAHGEMFHQLSDRWKEVLELIIWFVPIYLAFKKLSKNI